MFSFQKRRQLLDVSSVLRRIADLTAPNLAPPGGESRTENRCNRSLPALLSPWENDNFVPGECAFAITKDVSDAGVALVLHQPFRAAEAVVGFWPVTQRDAAGDSSPFFALGEVRQNVEIGGGFWQLGVRLTSLLTDASHVRRLKPLAARLLPPGSRRPPAPSQTRANN